MSRSSSARFEIKYLVFGQITRDYIIPYFGKPANDIAGGNALYTAVGAAIWDEGIGIISQVGENYPFQELLDLQIHGIDVEGVTILARNLDLRRFHSRHSQKENKKSSPVGDYSNSNHVFPPGLIDFQNPGSGKRLVSQQKEIPPRYQDASAAHFCAQESTSLILTLGNLRKFSIKTTSIAPSDDLMKNNQYSKLASLIHGATISIISEKQLRTLFPNPNMEIWQLMEHFASIGNEIIVCRRGQKGQLVFDTVGKKRWQIPAYPARVMNPTGAGDAYCGGFMVGYCRNYDPLEAALYGNVSASMVLDGIGIYHPLNSINGLKFARLERIRRYTRII